jgi:two-component system, cell cycle sensor histidine kinase and response regulator CckA
MAAAPVVRLRELLRRLAILSVPVALAELALSRHWSESLGVSAAALLLLAGLWVVRPSTSSWTPVEQFLEGVLLAAAGAAAGSPTLVLAAFYGGVYYRALAEGRHAPARAALTYQGIYLVALIAAHPHPDASFARQLLAAIPGFGFGAVLMHMLSRALQKREAAQAMALEGDARFQRLVETAYEGVVATDAIGQISYVNARACAMLGHDADEMLGRQLFVFMTSESSFQARTLFARRQLGFADLHELAFRTAGGEEIWTLCSSSPIMSDDEKFGGALVMMTDITQRRQAQRELKQANETLTTLVNAAPLPIVVIDRDYRVTLWNPAAERLFDWTAADVLGRPLPTVPVDARSEFLDMRRREERGEEVPGIEARRRRRDGSEVDIYLATAPLRGVDGSIVGSVGVYTDISQRKQLQAQLNQAQKMEAVGQLAGGVAHDFNNLLTVIKANASFLAEGCPGCAAALPEVLEIGQAANRAAALTSQLLAFSRRQMIRPQVVDVPAALDRLATLLRRLVPENIEQCVRCDAEVGHVLIDPGQLEQIVVNLVVNARDAMPAGGRITIDADRIRLDATDSPRFDGAVVADGDYVRLSVTDTGHGMSAETRAHVFEPFFTTKPVGQGTGLGLSMVYGIVKQNLGYVAVESRLGSGTSISVWLPLCAAATAEERVVVVESGSTEGTETILVVEDEDAIRSIIERLLRSRGYTVRSASNGDEALLIARESGEPIHLLLTDVILPGMSGASLAGRLVAERPELAVLFMSGYNDDHLVREGVLASTAQLLEKPFSMEQLLRRVRGSLEGTVRPQ